jgi:hypothetical protein
MNAEVRNNQTESRYEVRADGEMAGYTQYGLRRGRIVPEPNDLKMAPPPRGLTALRATPHYALATP